MLCLVFILSVAALLRFIAIGALPAGVHIDEVGMAYDSWCIANFGVDRYLIHNPVYFINYGGGQNALYGYILAIFIKLFGLNAVTLKLPAAFLGMLGVMALTGIGKRLWGAKGMLLCGALAAICPYYVMSSRFALESLLMLPMCAVSLWSLMEAAASEGGKRTALYFLSGLLFGITLYSYAVSYITLPIFLALAFIYLVSKRRIHVVQTLVFVIPLLILALPLILMVYINANDLPAIETGLFTITKLHFYRGSEISLDKIQRGLWESWVHFFWKDNYNYNSIATVGPIYFISVPLCILGLIRSILQIIRKPKTGDVTQYPLDAEERITAGQEKKPYAPGVLILLFFLAEYTMVVLTGDNINKANAAFLPLILFTASGILWVCDLIRGKWMQGILVAGYAVSFLLFVHTYFFTDYTDHLRYFYKSFTTTAEVVEELPSKLQSRPIYIFENVMPFLMAAQIEPWEVPDVVEAKTDVTIGNIHFYLPGAFDGGDVVILPEDSDARAIWEDENTTGISYDQLFINHYVVYYVD